MESASTVDFASAARALSRAAAASGLDAPSFRCPPRLVGVDRTIRRRGRGRSGDAVVSVRVRGRPKAAVLGDMIEGIVTANRLTTPESDRARTLLWRAVTDLLAPSAVPQPVPGRTTTPPAAGDRVGRVAA